MSMSLFYREAQTWTQNLGMSHQHGAGGKDHLFQLAASALPSAPQDNISHLCHKGTLLARVQLGCSHGLLMTNFITAV